MSEKNRNVGLLKESFQALRPHLDTFAEHFYEELFSRYPNARSLFHKSQMAKQKKAFSASLSHIVDFWNETGHLEDYLFKMGQRHIRYKAEVDHFPLVADALLATFEYYFEDQWTEELRSTWISVYQFVQENMLKGMNSVSLNSQDGPKDNVLPSIDETARALAREAFKKALEEEASAMILDLAREKAKEILRKALELEAKDAMRGVSRRAA